MSEEEDDEDGEESHAVVVETSRQQIALVAFPRAALRLPRALRGRSCSLRSLRSRSPPGPAGQAAAHTSRDD
jgi:hypothetical protein